MGAHLHFDCFSGVSGDMVLGALVDLGVPFSQLVNGLNGLRLSGFTVKKRHVRRGAVYATKVDVIIRKGLHAPLSLSRIHRILTASRLPDTVKRQSRAVFDRLAEAEGQAHRVAKAKVHFHEVSVLDSFVDVVGGVLGCHLLGATRITSSPVNVGSGTLQSMHGILPVPGPAVAALAKGIPIYSAGPSRELATPTGLALLRTVASDFGPMPTMMPTAVGYGAADSNPNGWPNVLRLFLARSPSRAGREHDSIFQVETNLDDVNPQTYEHVMEQLFVQGALDVTLTPVIMKRGRPGIVVTCLVGPSNVDPVLDVLFKETTALGVRIQQINREILSRRVTSVKVRGGAVRIKIAETEATKAKAAPEYLDCKRIAERTGRPVKDVLEEAMVAFAKSSAGGSKNSL